ncbi:MAG: hypothetical protein ACO1PZ_05935 [Gammaproteobacteria bacterium]
MTTLLLVYAGQSFASLLPCHLHEGIAHAAMSHAAMPHAAMSHAVSHAAVSHASMSHSPMSHAAMSHAEGTMAAARAVHDHHPAAELHRQHEHSADMHHAMDHSHVAMTESYDAQDAGGLAASDAADCCTATGCSMNSCSLHGVLHAAAVEAAVPATTKVYPYGSHRSSFPIVPHFRPPISG